MVNQESEDLIDNEQDINNNNNNNKQPSTPLTMTTTNMNRAFDELFAAAEYGDSSISAMIEAKMAADAVNAQDESNEAANTNNNINTDEMAMTNSLMMKKRNSIARSRNGSFRNTVTGTHQSTGSVKASSRTPPNDDLRLQTDDHVSSSTLTKKAFNSSLKTEDYLGSPQNLTRSCSCKRPSSFKRMKSKNNSPNRLLHPDEVNNANGGNSPRSSQGRTPTLASATPSPSHINDQRRGTQCSISIMDDIENQMNNPNRAGSLPFDQQQQRLHVFDYDYDGEDAAPEVYRVRQFHTTNKGSVINRGDSFKRSFKKSSQSIASGSKNANGNGKKENNNNLNLPDFHHNHNQQQQNDNGGGIKETSFIQNGNDEFNEAPKKTNDALKNKEAFMQHIMQVLTYVVYVMGASTVGKNALIKQFKTSEYRGTYDLNGHMSQGKMMK